MTRFLLPDPWVPLNLGNKPKPPVWKVRDFFAENWITLMHGREGSGKSNAYQSLIGAALNGVQWLGRDVDINRILVVDEENPPEVVAQRLTAMGYDHAKHRDRLLYFNQIGCQLGDPKWNSEILAIVEDVKADFVVIDSMSAATIATNDNESITPLFRSVFRPLARLKCGVCIVHHDRKMGGSVGDRASGGVQWMAQIDRQVSFEKMGGMIEGITDEGVTRRGFPIKILRGGKARQGSPIPETHLMIKSESLPNRPDDLAQMWLDIVPTRHY